MSIGLIGRKVGMTQVFQDDGTMIPVSVVAIQPNTVTRLRTPERDGYTAIQLGTEPGKKLTKPEAGQLRDLPKVAVIREFRVEDVADYQVGQKLGVGVFALGDVVHVTGITRGRGFAGGMRRWGWHGGPGSHGSMFSRRIGSIGSGTSPGRPLKGRTMPGHYGVEQVTVRNLSIVKLEPERGVLYVNGAIPGHRGAVVLIRKKA